MPASLTHITVQDILAELQSLGTEQTKNTFLRHGAREPFYGVKVGDLKTLQKRLKGRHDLALELWATGNSDAMYLAGLIADPRQMTREQLQSWAETAYWTMLSEYSVAWTAAESPYGQGLALRWIDDEREHVAAAGWATLGSLLSVKPDEELDTNLLRQLLQRVRTTIHQAPNRVRYTMNGFVIALGSYVPALTEEAIDAAEAIGKVHVDMGGTACKVPPAAEYIGKVREKGTLGRKRKTAKC